MEINKNLNFNHMPINILFNQQSSEYTLFYSDPQKNSILTYTLPNELVHRDALIKMSRRFRDIKFSGLPSLIEFCKNEKLYNLQIVLEWISFFIYKEERKSFDCYKSQNVFLIPGIKTLIEKLSNEKEEVCVENGFKFFFSDLRNMLIKLLLQIANYSVPSTINDFNSFLNKFMLLIFDLNFEDAMNLLKEVMNTKDKKKITSDNMTFFIIMEPVLSHFCTSTNSSYFSLNSTVKNLMETLDKIDNPQISFLISFIQQKLNTKLPEFLVNQDTSIFLKLIYILKYSHSEEIKNHLEILEEYYMHSGCLEGLIVTGNTKNSIFLLQNYIDKTDDLLVSYILSKFFIDSKEIFFNKCEAELFDSLNRMMMFNERIHLNQKMNEILLHMSRSSIMNINSPTSEKKINYSNLNGNNFVELVLNCFYCNTKIYKDKIEQFRNIFLNNKESSEYIDFCPKCIKKLPSCSICLCPIELNIPQKSKNFPMNHSNTELKREKLEQNEDSKWPEMKYVWCTKCRHGGHLDHMKEWFNDLLMCPVADCSCVCLEYNHIIL